ncbi:MAG: hypothetical protein AAF571_07915 [Verrucomicrobiota bacterium]
MLTINKRPDKTFLIQAGNHFFRTDLRCAEVGYQVIRTIRGGNEPNSPEGEYVPGRPSRNINISGITALMKRAPRPAREITVLSDQVNAVVSDIDVLDESDWQNAARMEAQSISGLSTAESIFASSRLASEQALAKAWTVQVSIREVAGLRAAIQKSCSSCRLVCVGHPAGIRIQTPQAQLENWSDFALYHVPNVPNIDLKAWSGETAIEDALSDPVVAEGLLPSDNPATVIIASDQQFENSNSLNWLDLAEDSSIETWAAALAEAADPLSGRILGMPVVTVPKAPMNAKTLGLISAGFSLLMLLILGVHFGLNYMQQKHLEEGLATVSAPTQKLNSSVQQINSLKKELKKLDLEIASLDQTEEIDVLAHRRRISALLAGVSAGSNTQDAVILEISPEDDLNTALIGMATTFNAPQQLARDIDRQLASSGWRARLFRRTAKLLSDDGGPWTYEIRLSPSSPRQVPEREEVITNQESSPHPPTTSEQNALTRVSLKK